MFEMILFLQSWHRTLPYSACLACAVSEHCTFNTAAPTTHDVLTLYWLFTHHKFSAELKCIANSRMHAAHGICWKLWALWSKVIRNCAVTYCAISFQSMTMMMLSTAYLYSQDITLPWILEDRKVKLLSVVFKNQTMHFGQTSLRIIRRLHETIAAEQLNRRYQRSS